MKKTLIVVDVQKDFYHPEGRLSVPGAEKVIPEIKEIIPEFDNVVFTADAHPVNHCSFKEQGGPWPAHCVRYTEGQGIPDELILTAGEKGKVIEKGIYSEKEEYGAFGDQYIANGGLYYNVIGIQTVESQIGFGKFTTYVDPDELIVCGIAAEYCVLETLKNLVKIYSNKDTKIKVFMPGVAKFNPEGTVLEDYMKEHKIEEYKK